MTRRSRIIALACCVTLAGGFLLGGFLLWWWFYGSGLSEETAYKLAVNYAQAYAIRERLDLALYEPPVVGNQKGQRLYEFSWTSKQGGRPLTVVVDSMSVEVATIEAP